MWKVTRYLDPLSQSPHRLGPAGTNPKRIPVVHGDCWTGPLIRKSGCRKPRDRRLIDIEGPRYIGLRFALREPLDRLLPLVGCQGSRSPKFHATGLSTRSAVACTGTN